MIRRPLTTLVLAAMIAVGCADDRLSPEAAGKTSAPEDAESASPAVGLETTTTTSTPELLVACPRPAEPLAAADMDGDGIDEVLTIETVDDGQQFVACGPAGGRTIMLGAGVWYVAVFDVEPDGADEVFLGGPDRGDRPDVPDIRFRWIDPRGARLAPSVDAGGIGVHRSGGAGCVDVDNDGVRELVHVWVDTAASTPDEVAWHREVATARPFEGDPAPVDGVFRIGADDDRIVRLSNLSCGDDIIEPVRVQPPTTICDGNGRSLLFDVDGDGLDDRLRQRHSDSLEVFEGREHGGPAVAVCTAAGINDEVKVAGMGEIFAVSDGTGDRPTIWSGGTSAASASYDPMVFLGGRIVPIVDENGPMYFDDGWTGYDQRAAFGCADLDGNGVVELVQFDGVREGAEMVWTRRSWETEANLATLVIDTAGRLPWPIWPEGEFTGDLPAGFDALAVTAEQCGWLDA